jgi:hypothetical protein
MEVPMQLAQIKKAIPSMFAAVALLSLAPVTAHTDAEGRWKVDGSGGCYFDANDTGPDQCSPTGMPENGRWKLDGSGNCYFDTTDSGPNQCSPAGMPQEGRWKVDANGGCYFDANDSGPNQCTPDRR